MHGTLGCPMCGASNIAFGSPTCPSCGVQFAAPVVQPAFAMQPAAPTPPPSAVAVAPARSYAPSTEPLAAPADEVTYASIWARLLAAIIDMVLVGIPFMVLLGPTRYFETSGDGWFLFYDGWHVVEYVAYVIYVASMQSGSGQATFGQRALDLRIMGEHDHGRISWMRAAGRELSAIVSALLLLVGYLMIAFTAKRQALHDKFASTLVVRDDR